MFLPLSCNFILPGDIFTQLSRMKCRMIADILPLSCHCEEGECPTRQSPGTMFDHLSSHDDGQHQNVPLTSHLDRPGAYREIATALKGLAMTRWSGPMADRSILRSVTNYQRRLTADKLKFQNPFTNYLRIFPK